MQSNLLILLLLNLAFAATLDNVPEEETNRVRRRGPSSSDASEKRTEFMEECGGDAACVRGKMRDWRKARKAGEPSLDRVRHRRPSSSGEALEKRTQFMEECGGDLACVRGKMRDWRKTRTAGKASLDRRARRARRARKAAEPSLDRRARRARRARKAGEPSLDRRVHQRGPSSSDASEKRTQFMEECGGDSACVRGKMRDWRKARKAGEPSF